MDKTFVNSTAPPPPTPSSSPCPPSPVKYHDGQPVRISLDVDAHTTSIPHLKARCLVSLAPSLRELDVSDLALGTVPADSSSPAVTAFEGGSGGGSCSGSGAVVARVVDGQVLRRRGGSALARLVGSVRLADDFGSTLDESSAGASVSLAKVTDGTSLTLEWGAPPACGKAIVKFWVVRGERGDTFVFDGGFGGRGEGGVLF